MKRLGTEVQYFGTAIHITEPFVAVDLDGEVTEHAIAPVISEHLDWWQCRGASNRLGLVDLEGMDWKDTLREFEL